MISSQDTVQKPAKPSRKIKIAAIVLTTCGVGLFGWLVYSVGFGEIVSGIVRFGILGFVAILLLYLVRITIRSFAWRLCVHEPTEVRLRDTIPAVIIGEAMSSTLPLGILISGTSKAVAIRHRLPLVDGLSSVATENLFYSLVTGIYLIVGAVLLLIVSTENEQLKLTLLFLIGALSILIGLGLLMVVRRWRFASWICEWIYNRGLLHGILENGRGYVHRFETLIYGYYRKYPRRFFPICLLEGTYHALGVLEVYIILSRVIGESPGVTTAFLLESVSRLVTIVFKLIPFNIGVDEAGAQFVGEAIALAGGVGVTLAIIRKGRILFWAAVGWVLIAKRGLSFKELSQR